MPLTTFHSNYHKDKREKEAKKAAVFNKASRNPWFCESHLTLSFTCLCWQGSSVHPSCVACCQAAAHEKVIATSFKCMQDVFAASTLVIETNHIFFDALMLSENMIPSRTLRMESCKRRLPGAASPQVYRWKDATGLAVSTRSWPG